MLNSPKQQTRREAYFCMAPFQVEDRELTGKNKSLHTENQQLRENGASPASHFHAGFLSAGSLLFLLGRDKPNPPVKPAVVQSRNWFNSSLGVGE